LRERREAVVADHMEAENRHDVEATIATMYRPRYELNGERSDGEAAVRDFLQELMTAFPDFHLENEKLHHADDTVIAEARVTATHTQGNCTHGATGRLSGCMHLRIPG
jgi:ketosteroid isomerase-like protein